MRHVFAWPGPNIEKILQEWLLWYVSYISYEKIMRVRFYLSNDCFKFQFTALKVEIISRTVMGSAIIYVSKQVFCTGGHMMP